MIGRTGGGPALSEPHVPPTALVAAKERHHSDISSFPPEHQQGCANKSGSICREAAASRSDRRPEAATKWAGPSDERGVKERTGPNQLRDKTAACALLESPATGEKRSAQFCTENPLHPETGVITSRNHLGPRSSIAHH